MRLRTHAAMVIAGQRTFETIISPGFYLALTIGLALGGFVITGFIDAVDSSGFDYSLNPLYDLIGRSLLGAFGSAFVEKLFAEGPFLLALYVSFAPVLLYLSLGSVFRFSMERKVGAVELVAYGPADGTAYFLGGVLKDVLLSIAGLALLLVFCAASAFLNNLVLGSMFFYNLPGLFFLSLGVFAYGVLAAVLTDNAASSITLFLGLLLFYLIVLLGAFTIVEGYVRNLSSVLAWMVRWISPLFYWSLGMGAMEHGNLAGYIGSLLLSLLLAGGLLFLSHLALKIRGVRV